MLYLSIVCLLQKVEEAPLFKIVVIKKLIENNNQEEAETTELQNRLLRTNLEGRSKRMMMIMMTIKILTLQLIKP